MEQMYDEDELNINILALAKLLYQLRVLRYHSYVEYNISWGERQQYIYRQLSRLAN